MAKLSRLIRISGVVAIGLVANGCVFFPFGLGPQVREVRARLVTLTQRVEALETIYFPAGAFPSAASLSLPAVQTVIPDTITATMPVAAAPSVGASPAPAASLFELTAPRRSDWPLPPFEMKKALAKLVRGMVNLATGWIEVPKRAYETTERSGAGTGLTWGLLRGLGYGFVRTAGGLYEIVTFPFPAPPDYRPVMRPVYAFVCEYEEAQFAGLRPPGRAPRSSSSPAAAEDAAEPLLDAEPEPVLRGAELHGRGVPLDPGLPRPLKSQQRVPVR